jgi:hypothetical protein
MTFRFRLHFSDLNEQRGPPIRLLMPASTTSTPAPSPFWLLISTTYAFPTLASVLLFSQVGHLLMMKISIVESQSRLRLVIEGKLVAPWTAELRRTSNSARSQLRGRALVIDLRNVTHISREGENALLDLMTEGARFTCKGVFTRRVLEQLARQCRCKSDPTLITLSNDSDDEN